MKKKEVVSRLKPFRLPVVVLLLILAGLGLVGGLGMGLLLMAFSTDSGADPSVVAFLFGFGVMAVPAALLLGAAWGIMKEKLWAWVIALIVSIPLLRMVIRFLF